MTSGTTRGDSALASGLPGLRLRQWMTCAIAASVAWGALCGLATAGGDDPASLRRFIDVQVRGLDKLRVPEDDVDLPPPVLPDGTPVPPEDRRFITTESKRYLGKQLYFDPVRTARILPEFGGVPEAARTASCGSCHLGEAASKAGTLINLGVGGEGRGYTDARGRFVPRRRIKPGLADAIPTLTEICARSTGLTCAAHDTLVESGAADAVDSVPRNAPTMIGFAFNTRLLQGGLAGNPNSSLSPNPFGFPAGENLTEDTLGVHRMAEFQAPELQKVPVYRQLFREAFPDEAARADAASDVDLLINDDTVLRAMATFLRTVVTRNTPWDRFLAGDDAALTPSEQRGARLFFTSAASGGAGCYRCHSGPMLNKQLGDEAGVLVEENFFNLGLRDHPLQKLNAQVLGDPQHRDRGRMDVTGRAGDAFRFRALSLRQLRDGRFFMHNGSFTRVEDVVRYFNAGQPQDPEAASAGTLATQFTHPRGPGSPRGLGLDPRQVRDLTAFLVDGLYDPDFVHFDPLSSTDTFEPNERDLTYSIYRPELAALGAIDGRMASGLPRSNDDGLTRRDLGIEFRDVTRQVRATSISSRPGRRSDRMTYAFTNLGASVVDTHLLVVVQGLPGGVELENASGFTSSGDPYVRVFLPGGGLARGQSVVRTLRLRRPATSSRPGFSLLLLSGQGNP